jgi:hypothetical protein
MEHPTNEDTVSVYRIDLSLPPRERYKALASDYKHTVQTTTRLFNELLGDLGIPVKRHGLINTVAKWLLRGVYSPIETAELQGICDVTGMEMYHLVAFNVVLDLLMGCTSSVIRSEVNTMYHLRTMDWGMDPLRKMVVQLDFFRSAQSRTSKASSDGHRSSASGADQVQILASSITYVGFVGCLTGVRPGLSMSLNFRAFHNATTRWEHFRFYSHHLAVLLGYRPSISSVLRDYLVDSGSDNRHIDSPKSLADIATELGPKHTTAAYLTFSDGSRAVILEKDFKTAVARWDDEGFVATTNHDVANPNTEKALTPMGPPPRLATMETMGDFLDDSNERLGCVSQKWSNKISRQTRSRQAALTPREAIQWVREYPTTNEMTHFATVLDPSEGKVIWLRSYPEPISGPLESD